ncbi:hypothetical protein N431DRAFT_455183 [Stipitochalara longipes BDJ]|nr:hypothetical protein N431DRAFT_455183 [Stipitochalara longipes BDJ]
MHAFLLAPFLSLAIASVSHDSSILGSTSVNRTISILVHTSSGLDPVQTTAALKVPLYHLTRCSDPPSSPLCSASKLTINSDVTTDLTEKVDINAVECRAYKDLEGMQPGSVAFNVKIPALLSTNLVDIGSIICYIVEVD